MRHRFFLILALLWFPWAVRAQALSYGAEIDFLSRYMWRGIPLSEGAVLEPSAWLSTKGFTVGFWANLALEGPRQGEIDEFDLSLGYVRSWKKLTISPSLLLYVFPDQDLPPSAEFYLQLSYGLGPLKLLSEQSFAIVGAPGAYWGSLKVVFAQKLVAKLFLESSSGIAWASSKFNDSNLGVPKAALNTFDFELGLRYYPLRFLYLRPHLELNAWLDGELRQALGNSAFVSGGLALGAKF